MGNAMARVDGVMSTPKDITSLQVIRSKLHHEKHHLAPLLGTLLEEKLPTNFQFDEMCKVLDRLSGPQFIVIPSWTLNLHNTKASAISTVNNWAEWEENLHADETFLRQTRILFPLFKPGSPIGHARLMFYDAFNPMPVAAMADELSQWTQAIAEVCGLPPVICKIILEEYEGLCPSRFLGNHASLKIMDSIPGSNFDSTVAGFDKVVQMIMDPNWSPRQTKSFVAKLASVRAYMKVQHNAQATATQATVLPSSTQRGLECIIISVVRALRYWLDPYVIPVQDCSAICRDKRGRRILA